MVPGPRLPSFSHRFHHYSRLAWDRGARTRFVKQNLSTDGATTDMAAQDRRPHAAGMKSSIARLGMFSRGLMTENDSFEVTESKCSQSHQREQPEHHQEGSI
jgi:hypothetical protein